jgi:hypothetical protein
MRTAVMAYIAILSVLAAGFGKPAQSATLQRRTREATTKPETATEEYEEIEGPPELEPFLETTRQWQRRNAFRESSLWARLDEVDKIFTHLAKAWTTPEKAYPPGEFTWVGSRLVYVADYIATYTAAKRICDLKSAFLFGPQSDRDFEKMGVQPANASAGPQWWVQLMKAENFDASTIDHRHSDGSTIPLTYTRENEVFVTKVEATHPCVTLTPSSWTYKAEACESEQHFACTLGQAEEGVIRTNTAAFRWFAEYLRPTILRNANRLRGLRPFLQTELNTLATGSCGPNEFTGLAFVRPLMRVSELQDTLNSPQWQRLLYQVSTLFRETLRLRDRMLSRGLTKDGSFVCDSDPPTSTRVTAAITQRAPEGLKTEPGNKGRTTKEHPKSTSEANTGPSSNQPQTTGKPDALPSPPATIDQNQTETDNSGTTPQEDTTWPLPPGFFNFSLADGLIAFATFQVSIFSCYAFCCHSQPNEGEDDGEDAEEDEATPDDLGGSGEPDSDSPPSYSGGIPLNHTARREHHRVQFMGVPGDIQSSSDTF